MATIDECYKKLKYLANKSGYNGNLSPNDFNLIFNRAEMKWFNDQYLKYGLTKRINDTLSKVKSDPTPISIDGQGKYTFPGTMLHESSVTHTYNGIQKLVEEIQDDKLAGRLSSEYNAPSLEYPVYLRYSTYLQFYPITLATASLTYLKKPTLSEWKYTLVSNRPVYDASTSVNPIWSDTDVDNIINIALQDFAINMKDPQLEQSAMVKSNTQS